MSENTETSRHVGFDNTLVDMTLLLSLVDITLLLSQTYHPRPRLHYRLLTLCPAAY